MTFDQVMNQTKDRLLGICIFSDIFCKFVGKEGCVQQPEN